MSAPSSRIDVHCVAAEVDATGLAEVHRLIGHDVIRTAWYADQTASTNTTALDQIRQHALPPAQTPRLILADRQTSGRGRLGRTWVSDESSLTFSLAIEFRLGDDDQSRWLSLAVGLGVARTLEESFPGQPASLKWPNDVYFGGGKVAGVLLETNASADIVVIGVGVNVSTAPTLTDPSAAPVRSIQTVVGQPVGRYELLHLLVSGILSTVDELRFDAGSLVHDYRKRCWLTGHRVTFHESIHAASKQSRFGTCVGVQTDGSLGVETDAGEFTRLRSGDIDRVRIDRNEHRL